MKWGYKGALLALIFLVGITICLHFSVYFGLRPYVFEQCFPPHAGLDLIGEALLLYLKFFIC